MIKCALGGYHCEDTEHFLLNCPNYVVQRNTLFNLLHQYQPLTVNKLLFGDCTLAASDNEKNTFVCSKISHFIT